MKFMNVLLPATCLMLIISDAAFCKSELVSASFGAGNIPFTYTGGSTTFIGGLGIVGYTDSTCTQPSGASAPYNSGQFPVPTNATTTFYFSILDGPRTSHDNLARVICPSGTTNAYAQISTYFCGGTLVAASTGCFSRTCTGTGAVSAGANLGTLATLNCP